MNPLNSDDIDSFGHVTRKGMAGATLNIQSSLAFGGLLALFVGSGFIRLLVKIMPCRGYLGASWGQIAQGALLCSNTGGAQPAWQTWQRPDVPWIHRRV